MANALTRAVSGAYGLATRVIGGLWPRYGGDGYGRIRWLLPGSRLDYEKAAGRTWSNPVVALALDWLGSRFPRPRLQVSRIASRNGDGYKAGDYVPLGRHPLVDLWQRPNPYYTRRTLEKAIGLSLKTDGNAYIYKVRSNGGKVTQLWWLPHVNVAPTWPEDGSEYVDGYRVTLDATEYWVPVADMIHVRDGIDPDNERLGLCALRACLREVCTINEESGYRAAILRNSGVPSLAIVPDSDSLRPTPEDADDIRDRFGEHFGGDNRGKPAVFGGRYRIEKIGFSPEELNLIDLPVIPTARIMGALGVAPMSLGLPDPNKTYSNLEQANKFSWGTVVATQELIAEALRWQLLPEFGADPYSMVVEYDYTEIQELQESLDAIWTRTWTAYEKGVLQRNEARELIGYPPDPDGDVYMPGTGGEAEPITRETIQVTGSQASAANGQDNDTLPSGNGNGNGDGAKRWDWRY